LTIALILIIALQFVLDAFGVISFYFQAKVQAKSSVLPQLAQILIGSGLKAVFIVCRAPVICFAVVIIIEAFALALGLISSYFAKRNSVWRWRFSWSLAHRLLRDAIPVMLGSVAVTIYFKIDQVMIRQLLDVQSVGLYAAALRISEAWYFVPIVISSSLFPAIAEAQKVDRRHYEARVQRYYDLLAWIAIVIAGVLSLLSPTLVAWLFGRPYETSAVVVRIHVWAGVFVAMGSASGRCFLLENLQKYDLLRHVVAALLNIALNMYFIPAYGIVGAAVASVVSYGVAAYVFQLLHPRLLETFKMQTRSLLLGWLELCKLIRS
jgi:O-antigen/teichoic acid export membrane protein